MTNAGKRDYARDVTFRRRGIGAESRGFPLRASVGRASRPLPLRLLSGHFCTRRDHIRARAALRLRQPHWEVGTMPEDTKKCAHPACTCQVTGDTKYCSQYCKDAGNTTELA